MTTMTFSAGRAHACFDAFGTYAFVAVRRPTALPSAVRVTRAVVADVDATCSRFRADSDLSRVNDRPDEWVEVDPLLATAVEVACEAAAQTDGIVNPLLGRSMVQLGYDRDFRDVAPSSEIALPWPQPHVDIDAWRDIRIDRGRRATAVRIPPETALDLGCIGKAWAADLVAAGIKEHLDQPAIVSLGGDVRIAAPDGRPWQVSVSEHPESPASTTIALGSGGLATSSTQVRRWAHNGAARHHIINPRTGLPAPEVWRTVTATGPTCSAANTASTAAVVLGDTAVEWLSEHQVTTRLVAADGRVTSTGDWPVDTEGMAS